MARKRTAKALAQRIDLTYFQKPAVFRHWRFMVSAIVPAVALVWLTGSYAIHRNKAYTAGPVSPSHAFIADKCEVCHEARSGIHFRRHVSDQACLACHDAPVHQVSQTFTPTCASCHSEHLGAHPLVQVADSACTECHSDLRTKGGAPHFVRAVGEFTRHHPEFAPLRPTGGDPGTVKLNHYVHLQKGLKGPNGKLVQMTCGDCHRTPAQHTAWPYEAPELKPASLTTTAPADPLASVPTRAYMQPIDYSRNCSACHTLQFDKRFSESVPHDKTTVVHDFVVKKFTAYIAAHPDAIHDDSPWVQRIPGQTIPAPAKTPQEWIQHRVGESERLLWGKTCKECHSLRETGGMVPEVVKADIPVRWLPHSTFSHESHRMLSCEGCHVKATKSKETADVLIPGIKTCQECHSSLKSPEPTDAAEARCYECHAYHDWTKEKPTNGHYTIPTLKSEGPQPAHPVVAAGAAGNF